MGLCCSEPGMGADLLSHEATFSMDMAGKARIAQHSTARDAGRFAAALQARNLVLTHFSNRYSFEGNRPSVGSGLCMHRQPISQMMMANSILLELWMPDHCLCRLPAYALPSIPHTKTSCLPGQLATVH